MKYFIAFKVLIEHHAMNAYGTLEVQLHAFLTLALGGREWLVSSPLCFSFGGMNGLYPLNTRLGGRQTGEKKSLALAGM